MGPMDGVDASSGFVLDASRFLTGMARPSPTHRDCEGTSEPRSAPATDIFFALIVAMVGVVV